MSLIAKFSSFIWLEICLEKLCCVTSISLMKHESCLNFWKYECWRKKKEFSSQQLGKQFSTLKTRYQFKSFRTARQSENVSARLTHMPMQPYKNTNKRCRFFWISTTWWVSMLLNQCQSKLVILNKIPILLTHHLFLARVKCKKNASIFQFHDFDIIILWKKEPNQCRST